MKKIIFSIILFAYNFSFSQNGMVLSKSDFADGGTFSGMINSQRAGKNLSYDEIVGSPYANSNFLLAKIAENYEKVPIRYNSYMDQIEFEKDGAVMVLPKDSRFSRIEILSPRETLVSIDTKDDLSGYFYELVNGDVSLYKKIKTKFIDFVPAANSYSSDKPATFRTQDPVYYIKIQDIYLKKLTQKEVIEKFPNKKESLKQFFKENNMKFNKEEDLKKLVFFLNSN